MSEFDAAQAMPKRIEVAYVRTIEPEAPPAGRRAGRRRRRSRRRARRARRARARPAGGGIGGRGSRLPSVAEASAPAPAPARRRGSERRRAGERGGGRRFRPCQRGRRAAVAAASPASGVAGAPPFEWPASTRLSYVLTGNYRGEVNGTAQVEWIRVDDRYQVNLDLVIGPEFAPLVTRRMTSEGNIAASGLVPTRYDEDTQVVMRDRRRVSVVFEADAVVLAERPAARAARRACRTRRASSSS